MNYLTNYYKNLCEQLQEKISILEMQLNEAGLKKALKTKDPELLAKEKAKAEVRRKRSFDTAVAAGKEAMMKKKYGTSSEAELQGLNKLSQEKHDQASRMIQNIKTIETAEDDNNTPDVDAFNVIYPGDMHVTPSQY